MQLFCCLSGCKLGSFQALVECAIISRSGDIEIKIFKKGIKMQSFSHECCLLKKMEKQELVAKEFGFYWENLFQLIEQVQNESMEIKEAWNKGNIKHLQEEVGDLIQAAIGLAVFCELDLHETLSKSIEKFQRRYDAVVQLASNDGHENLHKQSFETLMDYWKRAKIVTNNEQDLQS